MHFPDAPFLTLAHLLLDVLQQAGVPETWLDQLSKGSPYILALVIVAIMTKQLVPGWAYNLAITERDAARRKVDEQADYIFDLLRRARIRADDSKKQSHGHEDSTRRVHAASGQPDEETN